MNKRTNTALPKDLHRRFSLAAKLLNFRYMSHATTEAVEGWLKKKEPTIKTKFPEAFSLIYPAAHECRSTHSHAKTQ